MKLLQREPVRAYCYGLAAAVIALLVFYGVLSKDSVPLWLGLASAGLAVPAVEGARSRVTPASGLPAGRHARTDSGHGVIEVLIAVLVVLVLVALLL